MNLRTRYWLHRLDTRQAMAATCHPRLPLSPELLGKRSIAVSARRIVRVAMHQPDLNNRQNLRREASELLARLDNHLMRCDQQLDAADALPAAARRQVRGAVFARHNRVVEDLSCRAEALAAVADRLEYAQAGGDEPLQQLTWLALVELVS